MIEIIRLALIVIVTIEIGSILIDFFTNLQRR